LIISDVSAMLTESSRRSWARIVRRLGNVAAVKFTGWSGELVS
jgi:hypothetical protein